MVKKVMGISNESIDKWFEEQALEFGYLGGIFGGTLLCLCLYIICYYFNPYLIIPAFLTLLVAILIKALWFIKKFKKKLIEFE
jgi:ABC-type lipoprotein release transport system permease subunit